MKKSDVFVDNVASGFIALSVLSLLAYVAMLAVGIWMGGFPSPKQYGFLDGLNPFTRWVMANFIFFYSLKLCVSVMALVSSIGLFKRKAWAYRVFKGFLWVSLSYYLWMLIWGIADYCLYLPKWKEELQLPFNVNGVYAVGYSMYAGFAGIFAWVLLKMRRQEIRRLFR
jgi:hypothetical protein